MRGPDIKGQQWTCDDCIGPAATPGEWERRGRCGGPIRPDCGDRAVDPETGDLAEPPAVAGGRVCTAAGASMHRMTYRTCPVALARDPWVERVAEVEAALDAGAVLELSAAGWQAVREWRRLRSEPSAAEARAMKGNQ